MYWSPSAGQTKTYRKSVTNLHQEDIFIAVVPQHVVIYLGHDSIFVLPVEESDVGGVYFVLVLYG